MPISTPTVVLEEASPLALVDSSQDVSVCFQILQSSWVLWHTLISQHLKPKGKRIMSSSLAYTT